MAAHSDLRPFAVILLAGALLVLGACASGFKAEVTRFHQMTAPHGETVALAPAEGGGWPVGFGAHAALIGQKLEQEGYRYAQNVVEPDIVAEVGFGSEPAPGYRAGSGPRLGLGIGGFGSHVGGGVSTSVPLESPDLYYRHWLTLVLTDARTGRRLFEGTASGFAKGAERHAVVPLLADAMFKDFPGLSGQTVAVKLDQ